MPNEKSIVRETPGLFTIFLRHTWASWLTQNGVPLNVIQEVGTWEPAEMVRR